MAFPCFGDALFAPSAPGSGAEGNSIPSAAPMSGPRKAHHHAMLALAEDRHAELRVEMMRPTKKWAFVQAGIDILHVTEE